MSRTDLLTIVIGDDHELRRREGFEAAAKLLVSVDKYMSFSIENRTTFWIDDEREEKNKLAFP